MKSMECFIFFVVCGAVAATPSDDYIEIISKSENSVTARFQPENRTREYFVSIHIKHLADVAADYTEHFNSTKLDNDGYYYINVNNSLKTGKLYEVWLADVSNNYETVGKAEFLTDCGIHSRHCKTHAGERCLHPSEFCDGHEACTGGEDEARNADGSCAMAEQIDASTPANQETTTSGSPSSMCGLLWVFAVSLFWDLTITTLVAL